MQDYALKMLLVLESRDRARDFVDELRSRVVGSHPDRLRLLFPEWDLPAPEEAEVADALARGEQVDLDRHGSKVPWAVPETEAERDELERIINESVAGSASAAELAPSGEWV